MNDLEFLSELIKRGDQADDGYFQYAHLVACELPKKLHEQLNQLVHGPVHDGDVISKPDRDNLLFLGLAVRVCCHGQQGYTGATYFSKVVNDAIRKIKTGEISA